MVFNNRIIWGPAVSTSTSVFGCSSGARLASSATVGRP